MPKYLHQTKLFEAQNIYIKLSSGEKKLGDFKSSPKIRQTGFFEYKKPPNFSKKSLQNIAQSDYPVVKTVTINIFQKKFRRYDKKKVDCALEQGNTYALSLHFASCLQAELHAYLFVYITEAPQF